MTFVRLLILHLIALLSFTGKIWCTVGVRCVSKDPTTGTILGSGVCFTWDEAGQAACLGPGPHYNFTGSRDTFCDTCDLDRERCCYDQYEAVPGAFSKDSCPAKPTTASPYQTTAPPATSTTTPTTPRPTTTTTIAPTTITTSTTTRPPPPRKTTTEPYIPPWVPDPYPGPAPPYDPNPAPWYPPTPPPTTPPRQFDIYWYNSPDTTSAGCDLENRWYPFGCYQYGDIHLSYWKPKPGFNFFRDKEYPGPWWKLAYWKGGKSVSHDFYLPFKPAVAQPRTLLVITSMTLVRREDIPQNEAIYAISWVRQVDGPWVLLATDGTFDTNTAPGIVEDPDQSIGTPAPPTTTYRPVPPPNPCPKPFIASWYNYPVTFAECASDRWYPYGCGKIQGVYLSYCSPRPSTDYFRSPETWSTPWYQTGYQRQGYPGGTMYTPFKPETEQRQSGILFGAPVLVSSNTVPTTVAQWVKLDNGLWARLTQTGAVDPLAGIKPDSNQAPPSAYITSSYVQPTNAPYNPYQSQPATSGIWYLNPITTSPCYLQDRWYPWGCTGPQSVAFMNPRRNTQEYRDETYGGTWYRYPEGFATYYTSTGVLPFKVANLNKPVIPVPAQALTPQDRQILSRNGFYEKWVHLVNGNWAMLSAGDGAILNDSQKSVVDGT